MLIEYSGAQCGAGKTTSLLAELATQRGRYIYAVDRKDVIEARIGMIRQAADAAGTTPHIVTIVSMGDDAKDDTARLSVRAQIEDIPRDHDHLPHVIVIITHKGMTLSGFGKGFANWEIVVDEDPVSFSHTTVRTPASAALHAAFFDLVPVEGFLGLSQIITKPGCPSVNDFRRDSYLSSMGPFRHAIEQTVLLTKETDWEKALSGAQWSYWTVWPLTALSSFSRVRIVANAFNERLNHAIASTLFAGEITFQEFALNVVTQPVWQGRDVTIRYFTDQHRAGSTFFGTSEGRGYLDRIMEWVSRQGYGAAQHYWCANIVYQPPAGLVVPGERISPKIAGSNAYRACTAVTALYSAKGSRGEVDAIELLTAGAHGAERIERDREVEDLVQIVLRSSLRVPSDARRVEINVYDREQAEALQRYLERADYGCRGRVSLLMEDVGTVVRTQVRRGRKPIGDKALDGTQRSRKSRAKGAGAMQRRRSAHRTPSATKCNGTVRI